MKKIIALVIVALLIIGAVVLVKNKKAQSTSLTTPKEEFVLASLYTPKREEVTMQQEVLAEVRSDKELRFISKYPLQITHIKPLGSRVKKGELLVALDASETLHAIESAKSELASKELTLSQLNATHARTKKLYTLGGASTEQMESEATQIGITEHAIKAITLKIKTLTQNLTYLSLYAPYDGVVSETAAQMYEIAPVGKALIRLQGEGEYYLATSLPQTIKASSIVYADKVYPLISLEGSQNSMRNYIARIQSAHESVGARIKAKITTFEEEGVFLPLDTVLVKEDGYYVGRVQENKAVFEKVSILYKDALGYVTSDSLEGAKLIKAKPDALLRASFGAHIKEAH